ncbi:MAG: hypothetical protein FJZ87_17190, partial [Chloroflexi bacterium]|nr:hypothetical protein [Chloroflexota bacterium]
MNKRTGVPLLIGFFSLGGLIILGFLVVGWLRYSQGQAQLNDLPPIIRITEPQSGMEFPTASHLSVLADIFNTSEAPLQRVEVWLDGELIEERKATDAELSSSLLTQLLMPSEGVHVLSMQAVNQSGIIGQSDPVIIVGIQGSPEVNLLVPLPEGKDLAGLAADHNTDEGTLQKLNPALSGGQPAPGAIVAVPKIPENEPPAAPPVSPGTLQPINPATLPLHPAGAPAWIVMLLDAHLPAAPSNLQAQQQDCSVTLVWDDNASDEAGFNIWMKGLNAPAQIIASLQPSKGGQTWYKFPAPATGSLMFWVEAFNGIGGQPSHIVVVQVADQCPTSLPTALQVDVMDLNVSGAYDRVYCYLSLEGALERRIPENDGVFIPVQNGQGNFTAFSHMFSLPVPGDQSVEISGECWGWAGSALTKLGTFSSQFPLQSWNGGRQELDSGAYKIGLAISPLGAAKASGTAAYDKFPDPFLPPPFNVMEEGERCPGSNCSGVFLSWKWQPSADFKGQLTGFDIYLDGKLYTSVTDPKERSAPVIPPAGCGKPVRWQVAAVSGVVRSMLSLPFEYDLPLCQGYAVVKFETLEIPWTGDGVSDGPCDELELYYELGLCSSGYGCQKKSFGWGGEESGCNAVLTAFFPTAGLFCTGGSIMYVLPIQCTKDAPPYSFAELGRPYDAQNPDRLIVSIPVHNINIEVGTFFFDQDDGNPNDPFGFRWLKHNYPDLQFAQTDLGCGKTFRDPPDDY